jgi:FkbM family methyltransferase
MSMATMSRNGLTIFVRDEEPAFDDKFTVREIFDEDAYRFDPKWVKDGVVIDIGANIGCFSLLAAKSGAKKILSFEPEPHNLEILNLNVAANDLPIEVIPHPVGYPRLTYIDNGSGHSQIGRESGSPVEVIDINPYLDQIDHILLVKLDCEGGEYEFVETISDENLKKIERMVGEFHSFLWKNDIKRHEKMIERLEKYFDLTYWGYKDSTFMGVKHA